MTSFEQPPTTEPVSFNPPTQPPQPGRGKGLWILAVAALVVVGGAAIALAADSDDSEAATELSKVEPAGDELPAPPSPDSDDPSDGPADERSDGDDRSDDQRGDDSSESAGPERGDEPGEQLPPVGDVGGRIVVEDDEGRHVYDLDELDPGALLECMGLSSQPGLPPFDLGELGPVLQDFDLEGFDPEDFNFEDFNFEDFDWQQLQDELGPMLDQFEVPSDGTGDLDDVDLQAIFDELGIESLDDLDVAKLMEVLQQLHLGPLFGQFGELGEFGELGRPVPGGNSQRAIPLLPSSIEECLPD